MAPSNTSIFLHSFERALVKSGSADVASWLGLGLALRIRVRHSVGIRNTVRGIVKLINYSVTHCNIRRSAFYSWPFNPIFFPDVTPSLLLQMLFHLWEK